MFVGYTRTALQYRLYDPVERRFLLSRDVIFPESTSYYPFTGFDNSPVQPYYAPATPPWQEQLAWNDEFDEPGSDDEASARVANEILTEEEEEEEEEEAIDSGKAEEVLAPLRLHKPQCGPVSGGDPTSGDVVLRLVAKDGNREPYMLSGLCVKGKSKFCGAEPGELPEVQQGGRTSGRQGNASSTTHSMISTVYMVEAGPVNYKAAVETPEAMQWQEALDTECSSLVKNKVLTFVDSIPTGKRPIPTKLILQRKLGSEGETIRYKVRLVAQGFRPVECIDFAETLALIASLSSVGIGLAIAGTLGYAVHQMDVVTAFLRSNLDEESYVHLPLGVLGGPRMA